MENSLSFSEDIDRQHNERYHVEQCNGFSHWTFCKKPRSCETSSPDWVLCGSDCETFLNSGQNLIEEGEEAVLISGKDVEEDEDCDDGPVIQDHHEEKFHTERCNGRHHWTICTNPGPCGTSKDWVLCSINCEVFLKQSEEDIYISDDEDHNNCVMYASECMCFDEN